MKDGTRGPEESESSSDTGSSTLASICISMCGGGGLPLPSVSCLWRRSDWGFMLRCITPFHILTPPCTHLELPSATSVMLVLRATEQTSRLQGRARECRYGRCGCYSSYRSPAIVPPPFIHGFPLRHTVQSSGRGHSRLNDEMLLL